MEGLHADFEEILSALTQEIPPKILEAFFVWKNYDGHFNPDPIEELLRVMAEHRREKGDFSLPFVAQFLKPDLQENLERLNSILDDFDRGNEECSELGPEDGEPEPEPEECEEADPPPSSQGIFQFFGFL